MFVSLDGNWKVRIEDREYDAKIPGTLDENGIGGKDELLLKKEGREFVKAEGPISSRFTRRHFYMGPATYSKIISKKDLNEVAEDRRVFLEVERSRALKLFIDGKEVPEKCGTLSTPYLFEVTGLIHEGSNIELICDNSYPDMPAANLMYSSAATDETQTNWNGLIGKVGISVFPKVFISDLRIYTKGNKALVKGRISADSAFSGKLKICSDVFQAVAEVNCVAQGTEEVDFEERDIELKADAAKWDEYEGNLYECVAELVDNNGRSIYSLNRTFGIRDFGYDETGRLTINGRRFFLRGEANCAEFPEEGHWPMDVDRWLEIMEKYKSYGINCVRFHSHCPPEAAFEAADRLGIMVQPELSHWNPVDAFLPEHSFEYYKKELQEVIYSYANHPSFVMLTLGNELHSTDEGIRRMEELLELARSIDSTRLYAWGSNNFYGDKGTHEKSDFYTASDYKKNMLRATSAGMKGHLNECYPGTCHNYKDICSEIRKEYEKPIFGFEVGQYEILPDFDEVGEFNGISVPVNYELIRERAVKKNLSENWKKYVEATGESALMCYREEVEAVLRTPEMSGLSLLGIQDFPGQGTALVGMMNSHMEPKPYSFAEPSRFNAFFRPVLPLLEMEKYTYTFSEVFSCRVSVANYGKEDISGNIEVVVAEERSGKKLMHQIMNSGKYPVGTLTYSGELSFKLSLLKSALEKLGIPDDSGVCLKILVCISGCSEEVRNAYDIWVYPDVILQKPEDVYETKYFDDKAIRILEDGGMVYLSPDSDKESLPKSIKAQFSTDFWSVGTFDFQEGGMGQYIDAEHAIFKKFPTKNFSQWQWWPMAGQRAVIVPEGLKCIVKELDSYSYLRSMAQLFECRCLNGRLFFSSLGLDKLQSYPEAKALSYAIYSYMESDDFNPENVLGVEELKNLFD